LFANVNYDALSISASADATDIDQETGRRDRRNGGRAGIPVVYSPRRAGRRLLPKIVVPARNNHQKSIDSASDPESGHPVGYRAEDVRGNEMSYSIGRSLVAFMAIACAALVGNESLAQAQPNVIFIRTDDVGYGDLGVYGATDIQTPNLDQLASQGVRFTDFYSNAPSCTPTRVGFMTGRYQQPYGIEAPLGPGAPGLDANGRTLPQLLKNNGYETGLLGKWHVSYDENESPSAPSGSSRRSRRTVFPVRPIQRRTLAVSAAR